MLKVPVGSFLVIYSIVVVKNKVVDPYPDLGAIKLRENVLFRKNFQFYH
jgi:hypothetical protein